LRQRLLARGHPPDEVEGVLESLAESGLQSDVRWARALVRRRRAQGYGPVRIRAEIKAASGDAAEHLFTALNQSGEEEAEAWPDDDLARAVRLLERRFSDSAAFDEQRVRARAVRFLTTRGYASGLAMKALALRSRGGSGADSVDFPAAEGLPDDLPDE
jgi:regulatory protein